MAKNADLIKKSCELCGGTHVPFSQSAGGIKAQRQLAGFYNDKSSSFNDKTYIGGMCHSLSLYWLALRKKGDKTLFDWLSPGGIWNKGAINVIVVKTGMYKNNKNHHVSSADHAKFDDRFFANYALSKYGAPLKGVDNVLKYLGSGTGGYHMISLSRSGGGHAVAAHVADDGSCAFFDPNYGEFQLPSALFFDTFMKQFFDKSGYKLKYDKKVEVTTYR